MQVIGSEYQDFWHFEGCQRRLSSSVDAGDLQFRRLLWTVQKTLGRRESEIHCQDHHLRVGAGDTLVRLHQDAGGAEYPDDQHLWLVACRDGISGSAEQRIPMGETCRSCASRGHCDWRLPVSRVGINPDSTRITQRLFVQMPEANPSSPSGGEGYYHTECNLGELLSSSYIRHGSQTWHSY